ncbi:DUF1127 domain-containing protein [Rhodobacteraceae bacterium]|nr:DUF1127 domain-containing protein [Paracoccaceae bacterium]
MSAQSTNTFGLAPVSATPLRDLFAQLKVWNDLRLTRAALNKLTDRELDDIGLNRFDIAKFR